MQPDTLQCSDCPLLDLGVRYPVRDKRDPWRRMPSLFKLAQGLFGDAMMNHEGRTRLRLEKLMGHYCAKQRQTHGRCTQRRVTACHGILSDALAHGREGRTPEQRYAFTQQALKRAVTDEATYDQLKLTRVPDQPLDPSISIPPICFRTVPAA